MTFNDLIKSQTWLSIEAVLFALYPNQGKSIEGYEEVFNNLQTLQPVSIPLEIILSEHCDEAFDEEPYTVVSGRELNNQSEGNSQTVGIEFVPWSEWLGMNIEKNTLTNYTGLEIIAHCLFEMTFIGFNEDTIQNKMKLLNEQVTELENMTDEERKKHTRPFKEFLEELENENPEELS